MNRQNTFATVLFAAIIGAVVGALIAYGFFNSALSSKIDKRIGDIGKLTQEVSATGDTTVVPAFAGSVAASPSGSAGIPLTEETVVEQVYQRVSPSVVHVSTVQYYRNFFFQVVPQEGTGSGFIISDDGYVLTNNHVVANAQDITVRMSNGDEYDADYVGTDQMTDLAVLKVKDAKIPKEWVANLGDSDALKVGQMAIAIGNPFGLDSTVTVGVISALNRPLSTEETTFENMIQTDASINPGNSGGPLINSSGAVIGINTVILSQSGGSHGIGFAIPINLAKRVSEDLIEYGRVRRPSPGFEGITLYPNLAKALGLSVTSGVLVQKVDPASAAGQAGLKGGSRQVILRDRFRQYSFLTDGDITVALNGEKIDEYNTLIEKIRHMDLGSTATLTVSRGNGNVDLTMTLKE
ncbi:MAG: trypsin-like peptidase domain-containing protein [bacterium]